jgi:predicted dehydrogenase
MRVIVIGHGNQGRKRCAVAGDDVVAIVDPVSPGASQKDLRAVPVDSYDAAIVCTPDGVKVELLDFLVRNGRHVLVEKPLVGTPDQLLALEARAIENRVVLQTAYNHRFEPHFVAMRDLITSGDLGRIYLCRMFYGNGTARDVRDSVWRDQGAGVLPDLGSHLIDTLLYWFGDLTADFDLVMANCFENRAPDHVSFMSKGKIAFELEATMVSWRNHFTCDIYAERGSAHIDSLCKWGPSSFIHRKRVLPSGRPSERVVTLVQPDPTWALEYQAFKALCGGPPQTMMARDIVIQRQLHRLAQQIPTVAP